EPVIALTILFVALENIFITKLSPWRIGIVFMFGLIHGMGFASALNEVGLPRNNFIASLLSFNAGVELGQLIIILLVYGLLIGPLGKKAWYRKGVVIPASIGIACVALFWAIQRF
ncbi:MAG TPA: HupE/UreJ family protein, partial [Ferruginibacter sp.]|nr:HupE/UreJ family protein [Ferruginibacter sp.]